VLLREYQGERHTVTVVPNGYVWHETTYASLSIIARAITGTSWNGAFLSPRIIAAIVDGTAPTDLTVTGLAKALPYSWAEQEQSIGFSL
jgi:hypothetical protein